MLARAIRLLGPLAKFLSPGLIPVRVRRAAKACEELGSKLKPLLLGQVEGLAKKRLSCQRGQQAWPAQATGRLLEVPLEPQVSPLLGGHPRVDTGPRH